MFKKNVVKEVVSKFNNELDKTVVDRVLGSRKSLQFHDKERKMKSFENVMEAKKRTLNEKQKIVSGIKKPKNHVGVLSSYQIFTVHGRKHPLRKLRIKLFKKFKHFMRLNPNSYFESISETDLVQRLKFINEYNPEESYEEMKEKLKKLERSRCFQIWHDGSVVASHGHILFCLNILYDPAVFYTSSEYKEITGDYVDIQSQVESPELYLIGRCASNDEQLGYIQTRLECPSDLKRGLHLHEIDSDYDITINDTMRYFHGDGPAASIEAGNQKGGYYFCPNCNIHSRRSSHISYSYNQKCISLAERQRTVLAGKFGKLNSSKMMTSPFENLTANEMKEELLSRNVDISPYKKTKKDLLPLLKESLHGTKRVPILLLLNPLQDLHQLKTENILSELPFHLKPRDKETFKNYFDTYKGEKDQKRCCDWRKILLQLTQMLHFKIDGLVHRLFRTLTEIQRILYLDDDYRNAKEILRLHNSCFEHFILLKKLISDQKLSKKMTKEKLYGKYCHNLLVHAPIQYRLVSGKSINVENEERFFNAIKNITRNTSNKTPGHLIGNIIVRHQAESIAREKYEFAKTDYLMNDIQLLGKNLYEQERNSFFSFNNNQIEA